MAEASKHSTGFSLAIYAGLMVLLGATIGANHLPLGAFSLVVALAIAAAKALLVILFFMHVRYSSKVTGIFVICGFLWLGIMFTLTFSDYLTRTWNPRAADITQRPTELPHPPGLTPEPPDPTARLDFQPSAKQH